MRSPRTGGLVRWTWTAWEQTRAAPNPTKSVSERRIRYFATIFPSGVSG